VIWSLRIGKPQHFEYRHQFSTLLTGRDWLVSQLLMAW
jgi:hypothetical protein